MQFKVAEVFVIMYPYLQFFEYYYHLSLPNRSIVTRSSQPLSLSLYIVFVTSVLISVQDIFRYNPTELSGQHTGVLFRMILSGCLFIIEIEDKKMNK